MRSTRQRVGFLLVLAGFAVPLAVVSIAYACGRLATLHLAPNPARQGSELSGYGRNFTSAPTASEVTLRLDSRSGRVLWSGRPQPNGSIRPQFTVPANVRSGYHTILAIQSVQSGDPSPGTPARWAVRIGKRRAQAGGAAAGPWAGPGPSAGGGSGGGSAAIVGWEAGLLGALLSAALLGSGAIVLRGDRRRRRPAALPS